jgi:arsenate reductase
MSKNKIYHLTHCSTCKKILGQLNTSGCELQDIKEQSITAAELDELATLAGSYEALFSRNAIKYRSMGLHLKNLNEKDYRKLILSEYTFLKRPVIKIGKKVFVGHTKAAIEGAKELLS